MEKENKKTEVFKGMPKDKVVFASFVCEHIFRDENNFDSYVDFLGISDAKKEEKICDECIMKWKPITDIEPDDNKILYKVKGEYFFDNELMRLTVRDKIIFMVELDKFDINETLTYCNTIDQKMYEKIAELFKIYRHDHDKLSNIRNDN